MSTNSLVISLPERELYYPSPWVWANLVTSFLQRVHGRSDACFLRLGHKWHCCFLPDFSLWSHALEKANCHAVRTLRPPLFHAHLAWCTSNLELTKIVQPFQTPLGWHNLLCWAYFSLWNRNQPESNVLSKLKRLISVVLAGSELKGKQTAARDYKSLLASTINQSVHSKKAFNKGFHCTGGNGKLYSMSEWSASNSPESAAWTPFNSFKKSITLVFLIKLL